MSSTIIEKLGTERFEASLQVATPGATIEATVYLKGELRDADVESVLARMFQLGIRCQRCPGSLVLWVAGTAEQFSRLEEIPDIALLDLAEPIEDDDCWSGAADTGAERASPWAFELSTFLAGALERTGARSFAVYVREQWWGDDGFTLAAAPGIRHQEPLVAGAYTPTARNVIWKCGGDREWFPSAANAQRLKGSGETGRTARRRATILEEVVSRNPLFDRLDVREGIVSCARLLGRVNGEVVISLFANYDRQEGFAENVRHELETLCDQLTANYRNIIENLPNQVYKLKVASLLASISSLAETCFDPKPERLHDYVRSLLKNCLDAVHLRSDPCHATLHLYRGETGMAELMSFVSANDAKMRPPETEYQRLSEGEGVISWVALRGQPLLLGDVNNTEFARRVYRRIYDGVRSELAVPLFAGRRLVGVLNLESEGVAAFCPESVRFVSHLGNLLVVACELVRQGKTESELDDFSEALEIAAPVEGPRESGHNAWARYVARKLGAFRCSVWGMRWDGEFERRGYYFDEDRSAVGPTPNVRAGGWTGYVAATGKPVWITRIESATQFEAVWWDDAKLMWTNSPPVSPLLRPESVNKEAMGAGVRSELGMPLKHKGRCVGVAWLKYDRDSPEEAAGVFESWVTGDVRLVGYFLSQPAEAEHGGAVEAGVVLAEVVMQLVDKISQFPDDSLAVTPPSGVRP